MKKKCLKKYCCRQFKADQQTKGPPMGSRMLAPTSNNNLTSTSGFNAANQNTMVRIVFLLLLKDVKNFS